MQLRFLDARNIGGYEQISGAASSDPTYAAKAANMPGLQVGEKPIFIRQSDIPNASKHVPTGEEMFLTLSKVTNVPNITGIQKIGGYGECTFKDRKTE